LDTPLKPEKALTLMLSDVHDIITGCNDKEKVNVFTMEDIKQQSDIDSPVSHFIPIDLGGVASKVIWTCLPLGVVLGQGGELVSNCKGEAIYDDRFVGGIDPKTSYWQMKSSVAKLSVPVVPYSGYRVFFDWVSETPDETVELKVWLNNSKDCAGKVGVNAYSCTYDDRVLSADKIPSLYGGWSIEDYKWGTELDEADEKFVHEQALLKVNPLRRNGIQNNTQWGYVDIQAMNLTSSS